MSLDPSPAWQATILHRLAERDAASSYYAPLIANYAKLASQAALLKERNDSLLRAASVAPSSGGGGSVIQSGKKGAGGSAGGQDGGGPVQAAFNASLDAELATLRSELASQYKVQSMNAQRLLSLTDELRVKEETGREEREELRRLRVEVETLRERTRWHKEVVAEKEKMVITLQDELNFLNLELSQLTLQNENLKTDNASLLQRWIASKNEEATRANAWFEEEQQRKKAAAAEAKKDAEAANGSTESEAALPAAS